MVRCLNKAKLASQLESSQVLGENGWKGSSKSIKRKSSSLNKNANPLELGTSTILFVRGLLLQHIWNKL
jgi:hypothetical protein